MVTALTPAGEGRTRSPPCSSGRREDPPCVAPTSPAPAARTRASPPACLGLALVASACGVTGKSARRRRRRQPLTDLRIMVPNTPGGGYDITARTAAKVMEDDEITSGTEVFNLEGAGGTVGLARTVNEKGNADLTMLMGLGVVGASYTNKSEVHAGRDHPDRPADRGVRRGDGAEGLSVQDHRRPGRRPGRPTRARSASAAAPRPAAPTTCCPCSSRRPSASTPRRSTSSPYDGGGDLLPAILGDKVDFATSGAGEFKDQIANGDIRVLATSGDERIDGIDAPTLQGGRHRPGLHQLARRRGPSRHHRRADRSA